MNLAYKILSAKLKSGELVAGQQIGIQIDQTLTTNKLMIIHVFKSCL